MDSQREVTINQHGVRFLVSPLGSQKTGAFLDQRENYLAAKRVAHGRALDCFTFNGGFALHIAEECDSVLGIDISEDAITGARRNAELNETSNVEFRAANVFDALREFEAAGEKFDTIILDAPAAGHMLTFLSAPMGLSDAIRVGPVRRQSDWLVQMLLLLTGITNYWPRLKAVQVADVIRFFPNYLFYGSQYGERM